jgi:hypothetical protein
VCLIVVFVAFGQIGPTLSSISDLFHYKNLSDQFPEFTRSIIADLVMMLVVIFVLSIGAIYLSVLNRYILSKFAARPNIIARFLYTLLDVIVSLAIFFVVLQMAVILRDMADSFVLRNLVMKWKYMPYDPPRMPELYQKIADVYLQFLLPVCMSVLVPIGWVVMFAIGAFAAKGLIQVDALRRFAVAKFAVEKRPLLVTSWCLIAIWLFVFWVPVGIYAVLR